jgi:hypothetical protein
VSTTNATGESKRYVPLRPVDWLTCGPWWVRLRRLPQTPEDEFLASALVIGVGRTGAIHIQIGTGHIQVWAPEDAMFSLERSRDGVAWFDCSREVVP